MYIYLCKIFMTAKIDIAVKKNLKTNQLHKKADRFQNWNYFSLK